ncbi:MAG: hypothetical protein HETSPECPRED_004094 [Heterodermia speciosa]|uniref:Nitrogen regulatory protein areA GATA-like domain-containing protein n=1 Tax=Heterodermia speciosa TaxID=116794 RepID=A0A8H3F7U5_9LECA|nr:MAG: hypothetical protein HETSPECPRED_004094 [Heterodermia speciosa]
MAEGLPEGLVVNSDNIAGEMQRLDDVDVEVVIKMWKVYSASKAILPDGSGQRLANFLWRVWGSPSILYNLTGNQLAAHFSTISEDGPLRTTPTQSPRTSRNLSIAIRPPRSRTQFLSPPSGRPESGPTVRKLTTPLHTDGKDDVQPLPTLELTQHNTVAVKVPTSHISTPSFIAEEDDDESTPSTTPVGKTAQKSFENRTARPTTERTDSGTMAPSTTDPSSTLQSVSSQDTIRPNPETVSKPKRAKRPRSASTKKRPVAMKRKSSQSSSSNTSSTISPRLPAKTSGLPDLSGPSIDEAAEPADYQQQQIRTEPNTDPSTKTKQSSLVDPNFRSKFVEKTRSAQSSFVNLPSLLRKPSASAATSASFQATGMMESSRPAQPAGRGRGKVTFTEGSKPPGPAGPSDADVGDDVDVSVLPRTKSQLTMLLEKDRRAGGRGG